MLRTHPTGGPNRATRLLAVLAVVALFATGTVTRSRPLTQVGGVGTVSTSMVEMLGEESKGQPLTLEYVRKIVEGLCRSGIDGSGIDVALIDTGVAPVDGLDGKDKVLHGPDLSFEGASSEAAFLDTYGHGTHMAGIIAGKRPGHEGVAPGARLVSVKTAGHDGITTVPQVVAAIDWVVEHRNTDGLNIRVLNLSLGLGGVEDHRGDLLSAAVERAWNAGIFVVVAAGNSGLSQKHVDSPAIDPYVLAVGGYDFFSRHRRRVVGQRRRQSQPRRDLARSLDRLLPAAGIDGRHRGALRPLRRRPLSRLGHEPGRGGDHRARGPDPRGPAQALTR